MVCFTIGYTWAFLQGFSRCCRGRGVLLCPKYHMGHSRTIPFLLHIQVHQLRACWRLHSGFPPPSRSWSEETCCSGPPATCFPALQRLVFEGDPHSAAIRGDQLLLFLPTHLFNLSHLFLREYKLHFLPKILEIKSKRRFSL